MNPHNFSIYASGVCGVLMVAGAIWLLKTGVIKLNAAAKGGKLSIEIAKKVQISTTYPALGLFIIGLLFTALSLWFSQGDVVLANQPRPLWLSGKIEGISVNDAELVTATVQPSAYSAFNFRPDSDGSLNVALPEIKQLALKIAANGYKPSYTKTLNLDDAVDEPQRRRLKVPDVVKFTKINSGPVTVAAPPVPGHIQPLPAGANLEPLRAAAPEPARGGAESTPVGTNPSPAPTP